MTPKIDPKFRRLVDSTRLPSAVSLWNLLDRDERERSAQYLVDDEPEGRAKLNGAVAEALRYRPQTVRRWSNEKIVRHMGIVPVHDQAIAMLLLIHSLGRQVDGKMVRGIFDGLGIPHGEGKPSVSPQSLDASRYSIAKVVGKAADKYGERPIAICFLVLRLAGSPLGYKACAFLRERWNPSAAKGPAKDAAKDPAKDPEDGKEADGDGQDPAAAAPSEAGDADGLATPTDDTASSPADGPEDAAEPPSDPEVGAAEGESQDSAPAPVPTTPDVEPPPRQASLTTLDHLLGRALEDCVRGTLGALSEDAIDDAIDEFVRLNGTRRESFFHAGYRDVLFDRDLGESLPMKHRGQQRWYWSGAVGAWAMRERWDRIAREFDDNPVVAELASGGSAASAPAVLHIVEALRQAGRAAEIGRSLTHNSLLRTPRLFEPLLSAGTRLLHDGDAVHARHIFDLLIRVSDELEDRGSAPERRILLDARRRFAHSLRALREHERARKLLEDLLAEDPDRNTHAMVHADLGLMAGGFDSLEDVALRAGGTGAENVGDRLARGEDHFRQSVQEDTEYSAHGHYSLGVLALARGGDDEEAERHLVAAYMHFSKKSRAYGRLVPRSSLYAAIAKTRQILQPDKLAHAASLIADALASGTRFPVHLVSDTVDAFDLVDDKKSLRRVAEAIIESGNDLVLDELVDSAPALRYCPLLAERLHARAGTGGRPSNTRGAYLRSALRGHMHAQSYDRARDALDELERLARDGVAVPEFNALLADPRRFDPAWGLEDAVIARARCHEATREYEDATTILTGLFHRKASEDTEEGLHDAAGILARVSRYGIDESFYEGMRSRHDALVQQADSDLADSAMDTPGLDDSGQRRIVRVLIVGGAEQQAKAENPVRRALRARYPHIQATFVQTGWGSQWDRALTDFERHADTHDALVIMRFIRTNLGRHVRQRWPGDRPWRFCWSGGRGALIETVRKVAALVRSS